MFSYQPTASSELPKPEENISTQNNSTRRTLLNKRIPFPLSDGCTTAQKASVPAHLPPAIPLPPVAAVCTPSKQLDEISIVTETSEELELSLRKVSDILDNNVKCFLEGDKQGDFNKRLQNLYVCWKEGKLNQDIRKRLVTLCNFLEAREFAKAENIQVSLAVDYITECASWITLVKNIINEMKKKLVEIDQ